ncbi:putative bifunctional diguanylate cyclase/phosphodiesterase [Rubeoparvulum massiliense]|uniref:putative bifunctional diguanylate cyclase/phosphodiesterase n=1 Tax=Rubeoparvulum massiliense TaxID=1631346 RepID=UPI00065E3977|nr:bifunctional diguanylate cyclase/phosphodiesterase [Rubeoparvulum massiliense]
MNNQINVEALQGIPLVNTMFMQMSQAMIITDVLGKIITVNPRFTEITGYSSIEVIGKNPRLLKSGQHPPIFYQELWEALLTKGEWQGEILNRRKNGELYREWLEIHAIYNDDQQITHFMGMFCEALMNTEKKNALSPYNPLIHLPDRQTFHHLLSQAITTAQHKSQHLAVIAMDLRHFATINERMGHQHGDQILTEICQRLQGLSHGIAVLSREGSEFQYFTPIKNLNELYPLLFSLQRCFEEISLDAAQTVTLNVNMGISLYPDDGEQVEHLIQHAKEAMFAAKQEGTALHFYNPQLQQITKSRFQIESGLRHALARNEFQLYYQPQWQIQEERLVGLEALVRWNHPAHGLIPPASFIPICEENQMIIPLGEWVLKTACQQAVSWMKQYATPIPIAVNLSTVQFYQPQFVQMVQHTLAETKLPPHLLQLEITESMAIENVEKAIQIINQLRELKIAISMDDFGTGYSSLSQLRDLPIDILKLDRSFMKDIEQDKRQAAITSTIVDLAHSLNLEVIAEGVETMHQAHFLLKQGCEQIQGYLISPPVPAWKIEERFLHLA